jgi:poly-gamma-glutamate synthesis protein (capsule biosynthesis protein)
MARKIIDAGADLIIGHHPHVLRGVENYKHGVIAYSLGNFVCDMAWDKRLRESLIFSCSLTKTGIRDIELTPVYINDTYQPEILKGQEGKDLLMRIQNLSEALSEEDLSSFDEKTCNYEKAAGEMLDAYRTKSHRYFLRHLHQYSMPVLADQIGTYLKRRIEWSKQKTIAFSRWAQR